MEKRTSSETLGCGSSHPSEITLNIQTTTGGNFTITVENNNTVDQLKKIISKKLKVPKDRICLLHRERQLRDGTLEKNGLLDGSRIILLPSVETGLLTQRPESSVMQALESLNDSQVNDFLSGKSPLNLTMRLGDHMMLIQLQLSTLNPIAHTLANTSSNTSGNIGSTSATAGTKQCAFVSSRRSPAKTAPDEDTKLRPKSPTEMPSKVPTQLEKFDVSDIDTLRNVVLEKSAEFSTENDASLSTGSEMKPNSSQVKNSDDIKSFLRKQDIETLQNAFEIFKSLAEMQEDMDKDSEEISAGESVSSSTSYSFGSDTSVMDTSSSNSDLSFEEQSPIKSLSNLVSSPLKSSMQTNYSSAPIPLNNADECSQIEDKPPLSVSSPKYVPLPSSLKNNLIDSLVEGCENTEKVGQTATAPTSSLITDPIAANLTSCLCSKLNPDYICATNCHSTARSAAPEGHKMETESCEEMLSVSSDTFSKTDPGTDAVEPNVEVENMFKKPTAAAPRSNAGSTVNSTKTMEGRSSQVSSGLMQEISESTKNKRLHYLLHKTSKSNNPITQSKQKAFMQSVVTKHLKKKLQQISIDNDSQPSSSKLSDFSHSGYLSNHFENMSEPSTSHCAKETSVFRVPNAPSSKVEKPPLASATVSETKALIEASKNLTQTLKKLSKEVLTSKVDLTNEETTRAKIGQGAVIESMKHHGKGIYSGTFSGTLNPALQDRFGRPKRDISTIIHILNDLLCATPPQYRRGARITFEPTHNTSTSSARTKQRESRHHSGSCSVEQREQGECACTRCSTSGSGHSKCPYGECNGHYSSSDNCFKVSSCSCKPIPAPSGEQSRVCSCTSGRVTSSQIKLCNVCLDKDKEDKLKKNASKNCKKCHSVSALALENSKTKCKLDHLRLVMQQKKQRRLMRKLKAAPYVTTNTNQACSSSTVTPMQAESSSVIPEEIETLA